MLVLSRKAGQRVVVTTKSGEKIKIIALGRHHKYPDSVNLGFEADANISIFREEIVEKIEKKDNKNTDALSGIKKLMSRKIFAS